MTLRYDVMEFNTAIKPFAIEWLFENTDVNHVIYLDPDIRVYRRLTELNELLAGEASAVVTPHLTRPLTDGKLPNDYHMLQAGVFNLGFIAVSRRQEARDFVRWWGERLRTLCHAEPSRNLFTDQRWVDLAPCFLSDLRVFRSHAYNVAYWNLAQRNVVEREGRFHIDGEELAFFHFSGLDRGKTKLVSKHQDRLNWDDLGSLQRLFQDYRNALFENDWGSATSAPYYYDRVGNLELKPIIRKLYSEVHSDPADPEAANEQAIIAMCNAPAGLEADGMGRVSKLMNYIYNARPDLRTVFQLNDPDGISRFVDWYEWSGKNEYSLDNRLLPKPLSATCMSAGAPQEAVEPTLHPNAQRSRSFRAWRKVRKWWLDRH